MIASILVGLVVGVIAKFLMPGRDPGGFIITTLLGIGGAVLAAFIGQKMGYYAAGEPAGFVASVLGAVIILALYRMFTGGRTRVR